jgi:hypothetical protein
LNSGTLSINNVTLSGNHIQALVVGHY